MSRFDLYKASVGRGYLLDLQADYLEPQGTRMIAPVLPEDQVPERTPSLHPTIIIEEERFVLVTHLMGAVRKTSLSTPTDNLSDQADDITRALDILFQGY